MDFIFYNTKTGVGVTKKYPRNDLEPIIGLSDDIKIYLILEERIPSYDQNRYFIKKNESYTDEIYENHEHIFIYRISWELIEFPKQKIINKLNDSLGNFLDSQYPMWERTKHLMEYMELQNKKNGLNDEEMQRLEMIGYLNNWMNQCRAERDNKEKEFITNNIFPDLYDWEIRPIWL